MATIGVINSLIAQSVSHGSPDTDAATTSLHHTIGAGANQAAAGNHTHSYASTTHASTHSSGQSDAVTVSNLAGNLTQARSHDSPDTDSATSSLHHTIGTGANQAAAGNHTHTAIPLTFNEPGADHAAGTVSIFDSAAVGESVVFGDLLYLNADGEWYKADADTATTMPGLRIALEAKGDGETCSMLVAGRIRDDSWTWTVGGLIYASTDAGAMTQTAPSGTTDQVQVVGIAYHADKMIFQPSMTIIEVV